MMSHRQQHLVLHQHHHLLDHSRATNLLHLRQLPQLAKEKPTKPTKPPKDEKFCLKHPSDPSCVLRGCVTTFEPTVQYYTISASSLADAWNQATHHFPNAPGRTGQTEWNFIVDFKPPATCILIVKIVTTLPVWPGVENLCKEVQDPWNMAIEALSQIHEPGHVNIIHDYFDNFEVNLEGKTPTRALEIVNQQNAKLTDAETAYDESTLDGRAQGAFITDTSITCECTPPPSPRGAVSPTATTANGIECNGQCVDPSSPDTCGTCSDVCAPTQVCAPDSSAPGGFACKDQQQCPIPGQQLCPTGLNPDGTPHLSCIDTLRNANNCGGCGVQCHVGGSNDCIDGSCCAQVSRDGTHCCPSGTVC